MSANAKPARKREHAKLEGKGERDTSLPPVDHYRDTHDILMTHRAVARSHVITARPNGIPANSSNTVEHGGSRANHRNDLSASNLSRVDPSEQYAVARTERGSHAVTLRRNPRTPQTGQFARNQQRGVANRVCTNRRAHVMLLGFAWPRRG